MSLRIWHQSFTVLEQLPAYAQALAAHFARVARPGTEVVLHGMHAQTYKTNYPGTDIRHVAIQHLHSNQFLLGALAAEAQGFDAYAISTIPDVALTECRSLVDIPVVGYGEAAFNLAGLYGRRAGMLFFIKERLDFWPEQIKAWGLWERFAGIEHAGVTFQDVLAGHGDPSKRDGVVARIVAQGEKLVRETGADVIVPGELPLNLLLSKAGVQTIAGATVIDGIATCFKFAELLVDLRRVSGMKPSAHGYFHAAPDRKRFEQVLEFYGLQDLGSRIPSA